MTPLKHQPNRAVTQFILLLLSKTAALYSVHTVASELNQVAVLPIQFQITFSFSRRVFQQDLK